MNLRIPVPGWLRLHLVFGCALWLFGNLTLIWGLIGRFSPQFILGTAVGVGVFVGFGIGLLGGSQWFSPAVFLRNLWACFEELFRAKRLDGYLVLALVTIIIVTVLQGLVPPVARDALIHHLALPGLYLQKGRVFDLVFGEQGYNPMLVDMLFSVPLILDRDSWAAILHYGFALGIAHLIFCFCRDRYDRTMGLIGALLFLTIPQIVISGSQAYVDLGVTYFASLCFLFVYEWSENPEFKRLLFCAGLMAGAAMASKYNGFLVCLFSIFLVLLIARQKELSPKIFLYGAGVFFLGALMVDFPWLWKNLLWTGNPIYPYFRGVLGWRGIPPEAWPDVPALIHRYAIYKESLFEIALLPLRIFFVGKEGSPQFFDGRLSPVLLIFLPFILKTREEKRPFVKACIFIVVVYLSYIFFLRIMRIRYLLPIVPLLVLLTIEGWQNLGSSTAKRAGAWLMAFFIGIHFFWAGERLRQTEALEWISGRVVRSEYLAERLLEFPVQQFANRHLTANHKILFVFLGHRGYYCVIPYTYDFHDPGRSWRRWLGGAETADALGVAIRDEGITHLMVHRELFQRGIKGDFGLRKSQERILREFLEMRTKLIFQNEHVQLIEI